MIGDPFTFAGRLVAARGDLAAGQLKGRVTAGRFEEGTDHRVSVPILNLYMTSEPGTGLATQLLFGEDFTVFGARPDGLCWGQAVADQYVGYVRSDGLGPPWDARSIITAPRSHIYCAPDIKAPVLTALPCLSRVKTLGETGHFTSLGPGRFVPTVHLTPVTGDFVDQALRFRNVPYLWGGRSFEGIDCSGLVQVALMSSGQAAPRDSDMQQAWLGSNLPADAPLKRGDLIFWRGHVGIMVDGQNMLHANAFHMSVAEEPLDGVIARIAAAGDGPVLCRRRMI